MTRSGMVAGIVLTLMLIGCGAETADESPPDDLDDVADTEVADTVDVATGTAATGTAATDTDVADTDGELAGSAMLLQASAGEPVQLCVAGVMESYPPKCDGVPIRGDFSWEGLESESANGATWTKEAHYAVGHLDLSDGPLGSLTLTDSPSLEPPEGYPDPAPQDLDRRCQVVGDETGGAWHGDDCAALDLPAADDMWAAMQAVGDDDRLTGMVGMSTAGATLQVHVVVADRATVARVHELVAPWISTEQVVVDGVLKPLQSGE